MKKIIGIIIVASVVFFMMLLVVSFAAESIWTEKDDVEGFYKKMYYTTTKDNTRCAILVRKDGKIIELVAVDQNHKGKIAVNETNIYKDGSFENRTDIIGKDGTFLYAEDDYLVFADKCIPIIGKKVPENIQKEIKEIL